MTPVTLRPKCYIVLICAACGLLFSTTRSHTLTCSPKCRVHIHRHPECTAHLRADAARDHVSPASILRSAAACSLCPDLARRVMTGAADAAGLYDAVWQAYLGIVRAVEVEARR